MEFSKRTFPWSKNELIDGRWYYAIKNGEILEMYLPGGQVKTVVMQNHRHIRTEDGTIYQTPRILRANW